MGKHVEASVAGVASVRAVLERTTGGVQMVGRRSREAGASGFPVKRAWIGPGLARAGYGSTLGLRGSARDYSVCCGKPFVCQSEVRWNQSRHRTILFTKDARRSLYLTRDKT